ncbi:hypothetical protein ElyMa_003746000 [Elysia marginata]|uniref:Uncharacterized protein n=1 Tax=Elysia marginata TaxID=1093978 RepID=A0AAV4F6A4_9GAST|nr:hypothetical protein ElyMa_003746000 [Elysia marginata]
MGTRLCGHKEKEVWTSEHAELGVTFGNFNAMQTVVGGLSRRELCDQGNRVIGYFQADVKFKVDEGQPSTSSGKRHWVVGQHLHYHFMCHYQTSYVTSSTRGLSAT